MKSDNTSKETALENWLKNNRFCPRCGREMQQGEVGAFICHHCGNIVFPRIDPCVLVLIE